jgi:hypothetical protein
LRYARHGFVVGAAGGKPQFTVLPVAVPLFARPQSPAFTLVPLCRLKNSQKMMPRAKIAKAPIKMSRGTEFP